MNTSYGSIGTSSEAGEQREGRVARAIEKRTAKLPSDLFLWTAGAAIVGSLALQTLSFVQRGRLRAFSGPDMAYRAPTLANFVGQWAPTILLLGLYNKVVKVAGSDRITR